MVALTMIFGLLVGFMFGLSHLLWRTRLGFHGLKLKLYLSCWFETKIAYMLVLGICFIQLTHIIPLYSSTK